MTIENAENVNGNGSGNSNGIVDANFDVVAASASTLAEVASDAAVRQLASIVAKLARTAIVVRGPQGEEGPPGPRGEPGPPGVAGLGVVGRHRENLQRAFEVIAEVEAVAAEESWSEKSRAHLREARIALAKAVGHVASVDEQGLADKIRANEERALGGGGEKKEERVSSDDGASVIHRGRVVKRIRRGTGKVLGHGEVDNGDD